MFTVDFEKTTNDMIAKIDADPTEEGVSAAQAFFHGKKTGLKIGSESKVMLKQFPTIQFVMSNKILDGFFMKPIAL